MALGIAKARPKYTPPKLCKAHSSTTTILLFWDFGQCPTANTITLQCWLPAESGGLLHPALFIHTMHQDNADHCHYVGEWNDHGGRLDADFQIDIVANSMALNILFNINFQNFGYEIATLPINHVIQPVPWSILYPDIGSGARGNGSARLTFYLS